MKAAYYAVLVGASLLLSTHQLASAEDIDKSKVQIEGIIDKFKQAIVNKDVQTFMKLFLRENISWTVAYTDASVERYNASRKDLREPPATKVQAGDSPRAFIEGIARAKEAQSEVFSNVRIDTDGEIGHVWFDYIFMIGNYKSNWGKESWQLVRTEAGWKIAAVVWSAEENPLLP